MDSHGQERTLSGKRVIFPEHEHLFRCRTQHTAKGG